jgi:P4 family phage/plasmid primase-like protien
VNEISFFTGGIKIQTPQSKITIKEYVDMVASEKYKATCTRIRDIKHEDIHILKELRNAIKNTLDYVTIGGVFDYREKEKVRSCSGFMCLDIDYCGSVTELKYKLKDDRFVHVLNISPSGEGIKIVFKIPMDIDRYEAYVLAGYDYLKATYAIAEEYLDRRTKDISRATFMSYDPALIFNENSERFDMLPVDGTTPERKETDLSRSGQEWGELIRRIKQQLRRGSDKLDKEEIFSVMRKFSKWDDAKPQYREHQWSGALSVAIKEIEEAKEKRKGAGFDPYSNVKIFCEHKPFFYDKYKIFWLWNIEECKYEIIDEIDIMNEIDESLGLYNQTINGKIRGEYIESLKRIGRKRIPQPTPVRWIQFKDKALSLRSGNMYDVTPSYFFTNPIPWEIGDSNETPTIDRLFEQWVGKDYKNDLYEILAYCCYRDYPIQIIICLHGCGRNGKSQFIKIINRFLGLDNVCSTELDLLCGNNSSRFEIFKLYKKLACMMGETNFGILSTTSILKKLVGGDIIGFEKKGKDPFDDYNYAKIIIGSNSLPTSEDMSDGFLRRWHIIDFPNEYPEGKDIVSTIPEIEYNNMARKVCEILPKLIDKGCFTNQGSIDVRKHKYMMASNPLPIFIEKYCIKDVSFYESYNKLYTEYVMYLFAHKKRKVKNKEFRGVLENEGLYVEKTTLCDRCKTELCLTC